MSKLGLQSAQDTNTAAGQFGTSASSSAYNAGNAGAAGTIGGANPWLQGLGGLANLGLYYGLGGGQQNNNQFGTPSSYGRRNQTQGAY
jgi:hypothetical protein